MFDQSLFTCIDAYLLHYVFFYLRYYKLRSRLAYFIRAHVISLLKASSSSVLGARFVFCSIMHQCSTLGNLLSLLHSSRMISGSFLSLFRFKSCFDCLEARNNGCVSKQSELPTMAPFLGSIGALDIKSTYAA